MNPGAVICSAIGGSNKEERTADVLDALTREGWAFAKMPSASPDPQASNAGAVHLGYISQRALAHFDPNSGTIVDVMVFPSGTLCPEQGVAIYAARSTPEPQTGERDGEVVGYIERCQKMALCDETSAFWTRMAQLLSELLAERTARETAEKTRDWAVDRAEEGDRLRVEAFKARNDAERRLAEVKERAREDTLDRLYQRAKTKGVLNIAGWLYDIPVEEFGIRPMLIADRAALRAKPEAQAIVGKEGGE